MVTKRKGDKTRRRLLDVAFEVIRRKGFQAAGLGEILQLAGLTKGAIYHHFRDKTAMGYAVVDEIVAQIMEKRWIAPLGEQGDPLTAIPTAMRAAAEEMTDQDIALGCPLANLSAEMSALDTGFAQRIDAIYQKWRDAVEAALVANNAVTDDDPQRIATFIVSTLTGALAQAKTTARRDILIDAITELEFYLHQLRVEPPAPKYASAAPPTEMEDFLL
jgi:TetR/AcrR family transcriptional regulator, transcriptional repressor for nem operon